MRNNHNSNHDDHRESLIRKHGAVYTPEALSDYVAAKTVHYLEADKEFGSILKLSIVDPAVGDGMLLDSMARTCLGVDGHFQLKLCGIDINPRAIAQCRLRLSNLTQRTRLNLITTNSLKPFGRKSLRTGLDDLFRRATIQDGFDVLVANPPWGADLSELLSQLDSAEFETLFGPVDSFELFFELALKLVRPGGYVALIVPDSILNHGKSTLRQIIVTKTQIKFLARLGEGIFPKVYRGTVIVICKNSLPRANSVTECFRLTASARKQVLKRKKTFAEVEGLSLHRVPQSRFTKNPNNQFDIDLLETESSLLRKVRARSRTLGYYLVSSRGVELGKSGMICLCPTCSSWQPMSVQEEASCKSCGHEFAPAQAKRRQIVLDERLQSSAPLITGSDLRRYRCTSSRWILLDVAGIDYKDPATYRPPKILIRKTGVGLTAALDYTYSYTNQVVYIFHPKRGIDPSLEFFIGLINSRLYYFVLSKSFGELEWRSHPYLTQSQVLELPVPPLETERAARICRQITGVLKPGLKKGYFTKDQDMKVERAIGELFRLREKDFKIIFNAIDEAEELLPVRELKKFTMSEFLGGK